MRKYMRLPFMILFLVCCILLSMGRQTEAKVTSLDKKNVTVTEGEKKKIKLKGATGKVKWTIKNKKVAKIKKLGKNQVVITGIKQGKTSVTAMNKNKKYRCMVKVKEKAVENKKPEEVSPDSQIPAVTVTPGAVGFVVTDVTATADRMFIQGKWYNGLDKDVYCGEMFTLEYFNGEDWMQVRSDSMAYASVLWNVPANREIEKRYVYAAPIQKFVTGKYRIKVTYNTSYPIMDGIEVEVINEFEVKVTE